LSTSFASVGGFCCGSRTIVNHQRLNASGYVFSASAPPFLSVAALTALDILSEDQKLLPELQNRCVKALGALSKCKSVIPCGHPSSPFVHVRVSSTTKSFLEQDKMLQDVVDECMNRGILLSRSKYVQSEAHHPPPSIRLVVSVAVPSEQFLKCLNTIASICDTLVSL